jgi:hypothetical protein
MALMHVTIPYMRTLNGQYQLDDAVAEFFGARTLRFIARDSYVTGRFGREGVIRGSVSGHELAAQWHDKQRHGWLRVHFTPSFKTGELEYGEDANGDEVGRSMMVRVVRTARAKQA